MESKITNTFQSSVWSSSNWDASKLVDNKGLDGKCCSNCAHTKDSEGVEWFSLGLGEEKTIAKVQLVRRLYPNGEILVNLLYL